MIVTLILLATNLDWSKSEQKDLGEFKAENNI